jgi:hypothetical protein
MRPESITQLRVRMYRHAMEQARVAETEKNRDTQSGNAGTVSPNDDETDRALGQES